ncbi:MAG: hypothetical protein WCA16_03680 [Candidatus Sulfotelmatobacter sp.]
MPAIDVNLVLVGGPTLLVERSGLPWITNDTIETAYAFPQARIVAIRSHGWTHFTDGQVDAFAPSDTRYRSTAANVGTGEVVYLI